MAQPNETNEANGSELREKVLTVLAKVRPGLQMDGGDVELVDISEDGEVALRLQGACSGCPMAVMTLYGWIEKELKANIPEVKSVKSVP
jgi:Fe-S cluster biogenesis protein NfuA